MIANGDHAHIVLNEGAAGFWPRPLKNLRDFRRHFGHALKDALSGELAKDLTEDERLDFRPLARRFTASMLRFDRVFSEFMTFGIIS